MRKGTTITYVRKQYCSNDNDLFDECQLAYGQKDHGLIRGMEHVILKKVQAAGDATVETAKLLQKVM